MFSIHLKTFNGIRCNLNILDDKTGKYVLEMIRELNKVIPVINDLLNVRNNNQLRQIMNIIYGYHLLIVKFIKRLDEVCILK